MTHQIAASDRLVWQVLAYLPVPTADVAAIKFNHDGCGQPRRRLLRCAGRVRLHNVLADLQRSILHRAGILRPAKREQTPQVSMLSTDRVLSTGASQAQNLIKHQESLGFSDSSQPNWPMDRTNHARRVPAW
jgi:hypothetical protein